MAVRDTATGAINGTNEALLRRIKDDSDVAELSSEDLAPLRIEGFIYVVENREKGTKHAHLKDKGRTALGLEIYGAPTRRNQT